MTEAWHRDSNYVVVLSVPDEPSLKRQFDRMASAPARVIVTEPDMSDEAMAFAVLGVDAGRLLSSLPAQGKELAMS